MEESLGLGKKSYSTDTETRSWFRLPIPKPGFGRTLLYYHLNMQAFNGKYPHQKLFKSPHQRL